jgi:DNA-binding LacI/PurR family transcriptional regulator
VKKATRERIQKLLEEHHYMPNETARGLVSQSTHMVGILISDIRTTQHTDGVYFIERELSKQGYSCLIYNTGVEQEEQVRALQQLSQRKVNAAILMGSIYQSDAVRGTILRYLPLTPVIICNGYLEGPNIYGIMADEQNGIYNCVRLLKEKGRQAPAFIVDRYTPSNLLKQKGYEEGMAHYFAGNEAITAVSGTSIENIYDSTKRLLLEHPKIDSIIFAEDLMAVIGLRVLAERNVSVPGDIAVIGVNNSTYSEISTPPLTSLDNMLYDVSIMTAGHLGAIMQGKRVNKRIMIYSEIVERKTT